MTNNTPKHTPLPWKVFELPWVSNVNGTVKGTELLLRSDHPGNGTGTTVGTLNIKVETGLRNDEWEANAEFIVRACNAHYELLEALQETHLLLSGLELEGRLPKLGKEQRAKIFNTNVQAIKKAKGEA